ncbi:hypothetical protein D9M72_344920 [compost metagenome]
MVQRLFARDIARDGADHHTELDLPVGLRRAERQHHVVVRAVQRAVGLQEHDRLGRQRHAGLGGVIGIVQANRHDLADTRPGHAEARALDHRQRRHVHLRQPRQRRGRQLARADLAHHGAQVAHAAVCIDHARALGAGIAYSNQFHRRCFRQGLGQG